MEDYAIEFSNEEKVIEDWNSDGDYNVSIKRTKRCV